MDDRTPPDELGAAAEMSFAAVWDRAVAARGGASFLAFEAPDGTVTEWTYAEFDRVVARTAALLTKRGLAPGRSLHLALANSPMFVAAWLAAMRMGAWIVPSDPAATAPELAEHLARTDAAVGVCASARADVYRAAARSSSVEVIEIDEADATFAVLPGDELRGWPGAGPRDRAAVMFTSGTTGRPKGVVVSQANYSFAGAVMADAAGLSADDRQIVVLPMFHANAQYYSFASAIWAGAGVAMMHTFSASRFVDQAVRHRATHASLFAGPMRMILARGGPAADPAGLSLRHCWFAQNLADDQYETLSTWFGCRPRQLYGMTETIPAVLTDSAQAPRPDTMGYVTAGCEVEVFDADGQPCSDGAVGEIGVRGEMGATLFDGYLDDPSTTTGSFRDGWFMTGDRATRDAHGRFRFDGRRSDVLKVAGENVSVVEVEAVLRDHADVHDVAVVGAPDPIRDEVPVAFVVPTESADHDALPVALERWCEERLAKAKRPTSYRLVADLPRTSVGKVRTFLLKEEAR